MSGERDDATALLYHLRELAGQWASWREVEEAALADIADLLERERVVGEAALSSFKRATFGDEILRFREVRVAVVRHLDLVLPESVLPPEGETTVLAYGLDMAVPIPDLLVTDEGISATLSFSREPSRTFVPWGAIVGVRGYGEKPAASTAGRSRPSLTVVP